MNDTGSLIDQLARRAKPVRPLASPLLRTLAWAVAAAALVALAAASMGMHPELSTQMAQTPKLLEWIASLATGLLAAYAVFQISVPGRSLSGSWIGSSSGTTPSGDASGVASGPGSTASGPPSGSAILLSRIAARLPITPHARGPILASGVTICN